FKTLHKAGFRLAIASGSSKGSIVPTARRFGIEADVIVSAEDVERGKPHPDLFLRAAAELGADPAHCVVVEDSPVGLEAARAAGMMCFMFYSH
ncbi:MAG: HAD family hydrolase, partial [Spirochaetales bacterium]